MVNQATISEETKDVEACRKALLKAKVDQLEDGVLINEGVNLVLRSYASSAHVKQLELLLALLKQLIALSSTSSVNPKFSFLLEDQLIPAFQPGGHLTSLMLSNLEHPMKVQQQRASEALSLAGQLSTLFPVPSSSSGSSSTFIIPLFKQAINGGISRKSNLIIISSFLDFLPISAIPSNLLDDLLDDLSVVDCANIRSNLIIQLLIKFTSYQPVHKGRSMILDKLIPFFDPNLPNSVMLNMNRYLLPALFKVDSKYVSSLLETLSNKAELFGAWVTVASLGLSLGLVKINELPQDDLKDALAHEDVDIRIRAFELVSGSKEQINEDVLELVKEGFAWNDALPSAGSRSAFSSSTYAFLVRLHQLDTYTKRINRKKPNTDKIKAEQESLKHILPLCTSFHHWFLQYLDKGLIQARRFPVFRILLSLNLLGKYLDVFGDTDKYQELVFTKERVEMLLKCQMSEYTEVRGRSRKILEAATIPLPGYDSLSTPSSRALLNSALNSINLPRKTQAEAGKSALCILFSILLKKENHQSQSQPIEFVGDLIGNLEKGIQAVEKDLVRGIEVYPLHGSLAAIGDLLSCLDLTSPDTQNAWQPTFHQLFALINRIWNITKTVISLAPSAVEGAAESSRPDHEIARAYEVIGGDGDEEDGEGREGMDHTGLLSGCWRATRNAGELLANLISLPITQSGVSQTIWTRHEINAAGECFLKWMHEIRHRGTFSKIAIAFAQLVEAVRSIPDLRGLCEEWLQHELRTIASDQHSTTRRSAALPYSILSLVSSDEELLTSALTALLDLARVNNQNTSNVTKVHAFNVLKIVMLDARQTRWFSQWFEKGVMVALGAFESADWNVRNVGLILFSTLVHRCLSPRGNQDYYKSRSDLSTRQSFSSFNAKYPLVIPFITKYLNEHSNVEKNLNRHSPLFPILIIIRNLRYDDDSEELVRDLRGFVGKYLGSREYQVRQVAAQALSSLVPPAESIYIALSLLDSTDSLDLNTIHGQILYLKQLIANVIPWSEISVSSRQSIETEFSALVDRYVPGSCPPITQAVLGCIQNYSTITTPITSTLIDHVSTPISQYCNTRDELDFAPGEEARQIASVQFILSHQPTEDLFLGLLSKSATEIDHTLALEKLPSLPGLWTKEIFDSVLNIALTGRGGSGVQVLALDAVSEMDWSDEVFKQSKEDWQNIVRRLVKVVKDRCVPVKEAGLVALGWAVHHAIISEDIPAIEGLGIMSERLLAFSQEDESQPSRYCALQSLTHLKSNLFSYPNSTLFKVLLRLLQDDDEDIRLGASEIIAQGLGRNRGVVQSKSLEIYWAWLTEHMGKLNKKEKEEWLIWIEDLSTDSKGFKDDLETLKRGTNITEVLFEVEPSNIFRDPLIDLYYSNKLLASIGEEQDIPAISVDEGKDYSIDRFSPIDDAWEAKRTIERRKGYQNVRI